MDHMMPDMPPSSMPAGMHQMEDGRMVPMGMGFPEENEASHNKSMKLGGGGRFAKLEASIAARGGVRDPGAVAAAIGRKKYGSAKFQKMAAKGKKRAS